MGFTLCALFNATVYSGFRARVKAIGGMPHSQYVSKFFFETCGADNVWLLYLSRDDWFSTVGNGNCSQIEVVFENDSGSSFRSIMNPVGRCGVKLVYEQDMGLMEKFFAFAQCIFKDFNQSLITIRDGWVHSMINRLPKKFFQSASSRTRTREYTQSNPV